MRRVFLLSFVAAGYFLNAQTIGNSPYAAYGIGDVKYDNTTDINAMGGISTAYINDFNNKFNFSNPAANGNLDLTSFSVEASNENNFYNSNYNGVKTTKHSTYLSNLSLAFPINNKLKMGIGFQPYSSKAYSISGSQALSDGSTLYNRFVGSGSLSTLQTALSYNITPAFALGVRANMYFGTLTDLEEVSTDQAELINGYSTRNRITSFNYTLGTTYQKRFENDDKFTLGATYTFGTTGNMKTIYTNSTYFYSSNEKTDESIISQSTSQAKNLIPMEASLGVGYGHEGRWFASTQADYKKGTTISYLGQPLEYKDAYRFAAGGWYLPNYNNFRSYFSRVTYRFGAYYEKGNLYLNNHNINQFAVTGGLSLPFANANINRLNGIDLGVEVGKRGTLQSNLINQTFVNVRVGLSFADKWFQKRQYD